MPDPNHTPPKFFITHSWRDLDFARRLCDDLRARGLGGFFDAYSVKPGDLISAEISRGLEQCDVYVPILSRAALQSAWCHEEIHAAVTLSNSPGRKGRPRIIAVLIEDCRDEMPVLLRSRLHIDFAGRYDDALNDLLGKGFELSPEPAPVLDQSPAAAGSGKLSKGSFPTGLWAIGGAGFLFVLIVVAGWLGFWPIFQPAVTPPGTQSASSPPLDTPIASSPDVPTAVASPASTNGPSPTPTGIVERVIGSTQVPMVFVSEGEFQMGSSDQDLDAALRLCPGCGREKFENETPQHAVYLDAYWIDKFEVTNQLYKMCVDAGKCPAPRAQSSSRNPYYGSGRYDGYPVIYVSWTSAKAFCEWVGKRLPTEAEWEKAARGTDGRIFPWGNIFDGGKANYNASPPRSDDTTPVGAFPAGVSPYGAMDMAGNVWEWVLDMYDANYYAASPRNNPKGPPGQYRVLRGGGWGTPDYGVRVTSRSYAEPSWQAEAIGFRCAQ